jgi:hypothetical protein
MPFKKSLCFVGCKKIVIAFFCFSFFQSAFSQDLTVNNDVPFNTVLRININGFKIGIEQRVYKNFTGALSVGTYGGKVITVNPQLRYYTTFLKRRLVYIGLGYLYKHDEYDNNDTFRVIGTSPRYTKDFYISKYVHAFTINAGWFWEEFFFKHPVIFETNIGLGVRFKKSNRYGINDNEELSLKEAFITRPQHYEDTRGAFKLYPEPNINVSLIIPLKK